MPRRMVTSDIWLNERFASLPDQARLLFVGIITNADDDGRLKASPAYLMARVFPYDKQKTQANIKDWRNQCAEQNLLGLYSVNGTEYLFLPRWESHQHIRKDRYNKSMLPPPPANHPATIPLPPDNQVSTSAHPTDNQQEESCDSTPAQPDDNHVSTDRGHSRGKVSKVKVSIVEGDDRPNIFKEFESNIGMLTPIVSEQLISLEEDYPEGWVSKAIERACLRNHRSLSYIKGILNKWHTDGYDEGIEKEQGSKKAAGRVFDWGEMERKQNEEEATKEGKG